MINIQKTILLALSIVILSFPVMADNGFTVLGITESKIISNSKDLETANFSLNILSGGGQEVVGEWNSLNEYKLSTPIKISMGKVQETLTFSIENQNTLYKYESYYKDPFISMIAGIGIWQNPSCPSKPAYCFRVKRYWNDERILVINRVAVGSYGGFGNPDISWQGDMSISLNGTTYTQKIGSGEEARGAIQFHDSNGEWVANAVSLGALVTGRGAPNQDNYISTHLIGKPWKVSPKVFYEDYVKSLTDADARLPILEQNPLACLDERCSDILNIITLHNANVDKLIAQNVNIGYGSPTSSLQTIQGNGNVVNVVDRIYGRYEMVVTLRAANLGILLKTGKPHIEKIVSPDFNSGDNNGFLRVFIKNVGGAQGTFRTRAQGTKEVELVLGPGELGDVQLFFEDSQEGNVTGSVEVYDINSGESDKKEFQVNVLAPKTFIPNTEIVYHDVLSKSDNTGMNTTNLEDCSQGMWTFRDGKYGCVEIKNALEPLQMSPQQGTLSTQVIEKPKESIFENVWLLFGLGIWGITMFFILVYLVITGGTGIKKGFLKRLFVLVLIVIIVLLLCVLSWPIIQEKISEMVIKSFWDSIKI